MEAKYGTANVLYGQDPNFGRGENTGFANALVSTTFLPERCFSRTPPAPPAAVLPRLCCGFILAHYRLKLSGGLSYGATGRLCFEYTYSRSCMFMFMCAVQAFFYQVKLETELDEPPSTRLAQVSLADIIMCAHTHTLLLTPWRLSMLHLKHSA